MADTALIQGAAAVAAGKAAKGMAFREGFAAGAGDFAQKLAKGVEIREQKKRDGGAMADAHLLTYNPDNNMPEMYQKLVQEKVQAANEKLNEIGKDVGVSGNAKKVSMQKIVTDAENEIKGYTDYVNTELETISLMKRVADPDINQDLVSSFSDEKLDVIHAVGGGNYTLDNNKNYIIDGKSYSKREIKEIKTSYENAIYDTTAAKAAKISLIEGATKSKSIAEYNTGVEARLSLYNRNNPKDQALLKKELATVHGYTAAELQQIENEGGDYVGALREELDDIGKEFVPKPKMVAASGSEAYMNIRNTTNRYIQQGNLPEQLFGKTINGKRVVSAVPGPNNTIKIGLDAGSTTQDGQKTAFQNKITLDLNKVDDLYKIDTAIASEIYTGKDLQEFKEYYTEALNIKVDEPESDPTPVINQTDSYVPGGLDEAGNPDLSGYGPDITFLSNEAIAEPKPEISPGVRGGKSLAINSPFTNKSSLTLAEHNKRKEEYRLAYGDYTEQNLAKFRQDKEGLSDKQVRLRTLDAYIAQYKDSTMKMTEAILDQLNVTSEEKNKLTGIRTKTVGEVLKDLYIINSSSNTYNSLLASITTNTDYEG